MGFTMKIITFKKSAICLLACATTLVQGNTPQRMGGYDFSYNATGDSKVKPVQVFDDGANTFFQFRPGDPIPAIFVIGSAGPVLQVPEFEGPYIKLKTVAGAYALRMGRGVANVAYAGDRISPVAAMATTAVAGNASFAQVVQPGVPSYSPMDRANISSSVGRLVASVGGAANLPRNVFDDQPPPRIAVDVNSYATPIKGDLAQFQPTGVSPVVSAQPGTVTSSSREITIPFFSGKATLGPKGTAQTRLAAKDFVIGSHIEVTGRYDSTYKEGLAKNRAKSVVDVLVASGVPVSMVSIKTTEAISGIEKNGVAVGASVVVHKATSPSTPARHAFVSTEQIQEIGLKSLADQLATKKITPSQAARQIDAIRQATASHVQPTAGWQEAQINKWQMRAVDGTVQGVLQRWATESGWQLIWKNGPEIRVHGDAELMRDGFVSAADYLLSQSRSFGHRIKGRSYNNKVLVVTSE